MSVPQSVSASVSVSAPLILSLEVATLATVCTFFLGLALARSYTREAHFCTKRSPIRQSIKNVFEVLILAPMVFPPTITGYLLLLLLGPAGPFGSLFAALGVEILFTKAAAVIASAIVSLPLMYQACKSALLSVDTQYIFAAQTLGLSNRRIFWRILVPLARPGILGGVALAFARALGEFGATLMVAGNIPEYTQTLPLALYAAVEGGNTTTANIILGIMLVLSFGLVILARLGERRSQKMQRRSHHSAYNREKQP